MRCLALVVLLACTPTPPATLESVGEALFFDPDLSSPSGQSCADCHDAAVAFADPEGDRTSAGIVRGRFGPRNAPTLMYASFTPAPHVDPHVGFVGGQFYDGRAPTLEEQALVPLLNPLEMNNPDKATVVAKLQHASYARSFRKVFGADALDDVDRAFASIGKAIAAFERTRRFAPFASKYDRALTGAATLTDAELRGMAIFQDPARGNCASCHPPPLFTNHAYANVGLPRFRDAAFLQLGPELNPQGDAYVDHGLMQTTGDPRHDGKFRTPTLRNLTYTQPYGHNGYFRQLRDIVDFIVTRDLGSSQARGSCTRIDPKTRCAWPAPEVPATIDSAVGRIDLDDQAIDDLVAFLRTLDEPMSSAP
jgi:cytochrome c peroxidase